MSIETPSLPALRAGDPRAWSAAYALLWEAGMSIARLRLAGDPHQQDREDLVSTAIAQFQAGLIQNEKSYNQLATWDDCLGMFRFIVRARVHDFHRASYRNPVEAVEEPPELPPDFDPGSRFRLDEILPEIDRLQPDPPVPQVFRDRFLEGWSTDEIAERRGIPRGTLLTYFAKGLRTLRERLTRLEGDTP